MDAIRDTDTARAFFILDTMRNKSALPVHKLLKCALNDAKQKMLDGKLFIEHAYASRKKVLKRLEIKGRGRTGIREKPYCDVTIILSSDDKKHASADSDKKAITVNAEQIEKNETTKTTRKV